MSIRASCRPEEFLAVVDEADREIGRLERSLVHERRLRHRSVHIFVFNSQGEVFLQQRSVKKDLYPGKWDSAAAGHVEAGEDYFSSAKRELKEEIDLSGVPEFIAKIPASALTGWEFVQLYKLQSDDPIRLDPGEVEAGNWYTKEEVDHLIEATPEIFTPAFLFFWPFYNALNKE